MKIKIRNKLINHVMDNLKLKKNLKGKNIYKKDIRKGVHLSSGVIYFHEPSMIQMLERDGKKAAEMIIT